jgi:hypothetical protein
MPLLVFDCGGVVSWRGYEVLTIGWIGILSLDPRWFSNVTFLFLNYYSLVKTRSLPLVAGVTLIGALFSFAPSAGCPGAGGAPGGSLGLAIGGWFWVASLVFASIGSFMAPKDPKGLAFGMKNRP